MIEHKVNPCPYCGAQPMRKYVIERNSRKWGEMKCINPKCKVQPLVHISGAEAENSRLLEWHWNKRVEHIERELNMRCFEK